MSKTESLEKQDIKIVREFAASRTELWRYFTEPELFKKWFGAKSYTTPFAKIDLRIGGKTVYCMRSADGIDTWGMGEFKEIIEPSRIVITDSFADEKGNPVPGTYYGMEENWPLELMITYSFEELGNGNSRLTLLHQGLPIGQYTELTIVGWNESFDKLDKLLNR